MRGFETPHKIPPHGQTPAKAVYNNTNTKQPFIMRNGLLQLFANPLEDEESSEELIRVHSKQDECRTPTTTTTRSEDLGRLRRRAMTCSSSRRFDENGMTPLHMASRRGQLGRVRNLLKQRRVATTDLINEADAETGRTALMYACRVVHGQAIVQYLLDHGANPHAISKQGQTALEVACRALNVGAVQLLLQHDQKKQVDTCIPSQLLHKLCQRRNKPGQVAILLLLLEHGANAAAVRDGTTPLHHAAFCGNLPAVQCLVEHGALPNRANSHGVTPLHVAYRMQHYEVAEHLLENILSR